MTKVICSRSFRNRSKIGRRCFSKLFNAKARRVSAKEILRRSSKHLRKSKSAAEICKGHDHALLSKIRRDAAEASHLVSSQRPGTWLQKRRDLLRARFHDGWFR